MIAIAWPSTLWPFAFWGGFLVLGLPAVAAVAWGRK